MKTASILAACVVATLGLSAAAFEQAKPEKSSPDLANVAYGPHSRNVLDLWKAKSPSPTPLVMFIHGGGFRNGDKSNLSTELLTDCLSNGMSVMAINYRLSPEVHYPAHYQDIARAL